MAANAKAPMLIKPARSGVEAPPVKYSVGDCGEVEVGMGEEIDKGMTVVVVVVVSGVGIDLAEPRAAKDTVMSSPDNDRLDGAKEVVVVMAGGQPVKAVGPCEDGDIYAFRE